MGKWRRAFGLKEKEEVVVLADEKEDIEVLIEPDGNQKMTGHAEQHSALTRIQKDNVVKFAAIEEDIHEHEHPYAADDHDHDLTHDHDDEYKHDHPYAADDHDHPLQDLTHDHDEYFPKGNTLDDDGNPLPLPYPDANSLGEAVDGKADEHGHPYVKSNANTDITPTADNLFVTLTSKRPKEEDDSFTNKEFGLAVDIDEGNTYKNQFSVETRHGYALKVLGGGGRNTWFGGKVSQQGDSLENADARDYIIRKNLTEATEPLLGQIEHNEDRINALEYELEAIAETKESGEWELVSPLDFDVRGSGQMTLSNADFTASNNEMTLHATDKNGLSHGFSGVEQGDLVEVVEEHISRNTGDYGLYEVKSVNGMSFTLELQQGRGTADENKNFFIKFFHLSDDVNIAELDARYALKEHTHSEYFLIGDWSDSEYDPYPDLRTFDEQLGELIDASQTAQKLVDTQQNNRLDALENESGETEAPILGRRFRYTTSNSPSVGTFSVFGYDVVFSIEDLSGATRKMSFGPDFGWTNYLRMTVWDTDGELWYAAELKGESDWSSTHMKFYREAVKVDRTLVAGDEYNVKVDGYW